MSGARAGLRGSHDGGSSNSKGSPCPGSNARSSRSSTSRLRDDEDEILQTTSTPYMGFQGRIDQRSPGAGRTGAEVRVRVAAGALMKDPTTATPMPRARERRQAAATFGNHPSRYCDSADPAFGDGRRRRSPDAARALGSASPTARPRLRQRGADHQGLRYVPWSRIRWAG